MWEGSWPGLISNKPLTGSGQKVGVNVVGLPGVVLSTSRELSINLVRSVRPGLTPFIIMRIQQRRCIADAPVTKSMFVIRIN